jgi:hypothetical protein
LREVGLRINPPIKIEKVLDAWSAIEGEAWLLVRQGGAALEERVNFADSGWYLDGGGVWQKPLTRYAPLASPFCRQQEITVEAGNLSFDLTKHTVTFYVSRDRRP